jgi:pentatricopeptide repeat protein
VLSARPQALTAATCEAAMRACAAAGRLEDGLAVLRSMWERGVARSVRTHNVAMALCTGCGAPRR